jgi:hypothetical protein
MWAIFVKKLKILLLKRWLGFNLDGNEGYFSTSFSELKFKIKYLIEELSMLDQMKKSFYFLYKNWKYVFCKMRMNHLHMFGNVMLVQKKSINTQST